ncbi:MAG: DUF3267 domain-containing protein [Ruminococcus sp.]|nr:DUF3267 domain-containing protein [Ruminococcus sp.]
MKKRAKDQLPEGYKEIFSVNLQKDKKTALGINLAAVAIMLTMAIPMHFHVSAFTLFSMDDGLAMYVLRLGVLIAASVAYIILHELVHGVAMKLFGTEKVKYGFTGMYAFAGSSDYYDKASYIVIALAPIIFWGIVLAIINVLVPTAWFWVVYFIQITNISGAAGDLYVTFKFSKMPKDILVHDSGLGMTVYSAK